MTQQRQHKKVKLQHHSGRYTLTIPAWLVEKVLVAKKGDWINFDFQGNKLILEKRE